VRSVLDQCDDLDDDAAGGGGNKEIGVEDTLQKLLDETSDLVDSPNAGLVVDRLLDAGCGVLLEQKLAQGAFGKTHAGDDGREKVKLANVLAVATRQAHLIANGIPNEYAEAMQNRQELRGFSALVYSFFERVDLTATGPS